MTFVARVQGATVLIGLIAATAAARNQATPNFARDHEYLHGLAATTPQSAVRPIVVPRLANSAVIVAFEQNVRDACRLPNFHVDRQGETGGTYVLQSPSDGTRIGCGRPVRVTFSRSEPPSKPVTPTHVAIFVPRLMDDRTIQSFEFYIRQACQLPTFQVGRQGETDGTYLSQSPGEGTKIVCGREVSVTFGRASETSSRSMPSAPAALVVPRLVDDRTILSFEQTIREQCHFPMFRVIRRGDATAGTYVSQSPREDSVVDCGRRVSVVFRPRPEMPRVPVPSTLPATGVDSPQTQPPAKPTSLVFEVPSLQHPARIADFQRIVRAACHNHFTITHRKTAPPMVPWQDPDPSNSIGCDDHVAVYLESDRRNKAVVNPVDDGSHKAKSGSDQRYGSDQSPKLPTVPHDQVAEVKVGGVRGWTIAIGLVVMVAAAFLAAAVYTYGRLRVVVGAVTHAVIVGDRGLRSLASEIAVVAESAVEAIGPHPLPVTTVEVINA